ELPAASAARGAAANDHRIGPLVVAGSPEGRLAPLRLRLAADRRLALTTAVRMVSRIHRRTANGRPPTLVPIPTGLADNNVLVVDIADLAKCGHAFQMYATNLARRHPDLRVVASFRHQLRRGAGRADELSAAPSMKFDVVNLRADRDVAERQR